MVEQVNSAGPVPRQGTTGRIFQLNVSNGGVPKHRVERSTVGELGLEGDAHRSPTHGGPERAVCLFSRETITRLRQEGHPIVPGAVGENVTLEGVDPALIVPGSRLYLGREVVLEVTRYTTPCTNIADAFREGNYSRISHKLFPGESRVYASVIHGGELRAGDPVRIEAPVADVV